jgi:hypothetical protein
LGITHIVEGAVIPFAEIECDAVRKTLGVSKSATTALAEPVFGRALGRIVAHELYHILLKDVRHTRGLAAASFSRADLVASRRTFDAADLNRIAASLREGDSALQAASRPQTAASKVALSFLNLQ